MNICLDCARLFGDNSKGGIGVWRGECSICGQEKECAESRYDFGLASEHVVQIKKCCEKSRERAEKLGWMML